MANSGKDDNGSQFFFTFGPTQELQNKHTLFGKVVGDTIYNMLKLQEVEVDNDDRAIRPHKILKTKILINPFPDIEPRKTIVMEEFKEEKKKPKSKMKGTKDYKLLSFGDEAEDEEEDMIEVHKNTSKKPKSSHDLLDDPNLLKDVGDIKSTDDNADEYVKGDQKVEHEKIDDTNIESVRDKLKKAKAEKRKHVPDEVDDILEINNTEDFEDEVTKQKRRKEEIRKEIKALKKDLMSDSIDREKSSNDTEQAKSKLQKLTQEERANDLLLNFYAEKEKYSEKTKKLPKKGSKRENQTMEILSKFKSKLFTVKTTETKPAKKEVNDDNVNESSDDDDNWMANTLKFDTNDPILAKDANTKDDDWFDIYDPRNPVNKRRRENDAKNKSKR